MSSTAYRRRKDRHVTIDQDIVVLVNFGSSGSVRGIHPALVMSQCTKKGDPRLLVIPLFRSESYSTKTASVKIRQIDCRQLRYEMYANPMMLQSISTDRIIRRVGNVSNDAIHKELEKLLWEEVSA